MHLTLLKVTRPSTNSLYSRLHWIRKQRGVSEQSVIERLGVHTDTYKSWKGGRQQPSIKNRKRILELIREYERKVQQPVRQRKGDIS